MVDCLSVTDKKFVEGGMFYSSIQEYSEGEYLCPENGDFTFSGTAGTSLWAVPRDELTLSQKKQLENIYVDLTIVSMYFDIDRYVKIGSDFPWKIRADQSYKKLITLSQDQ
jgi:hypothetical protein